jgi:hypothetical protein
VVPAGSTFAPGGNPNNDGLIDSNETVTLLFAFRDAGGNSVADLKATLLATNGVTSPTSPNGTTQDYGPLVYLGHSVSRPFTFTAQGTNGQQIAVTFLLTNVVNNIGTNIGSAVFTYTLGKWKTTVSSTNLIIINADTTASPYPSTIYVSGVGGEVIKATVTLSNLYHTAVSSVDALVVAPDQHDTLIMGNAGGPNAVGPVTLTFDDAAASSLPQFTPIVSGTNKPTAYLPVPNFP